MSSAPITFAGRWACAQLKEQYEEKYTVVCNLPQMEGADYGDLIKTGGGKTEETAKEKRQVRQMEDTIKNRIIDTMTGTFLPNEMEQDWEEEDYNDFEEEQVFLKEMI